MASPVLLASDEELSDVQVLDSNEPLVTATSSRRSARVRDSNEPLVPASSPVSARVSDSNEPLVPTGLSSPLEEPLVTPGARASTSGNPRVAAAAGSSSQDDEEYVPPMATVAKPTRSKGRRVNPSPDVLGKWNWRRVFAELSTNAQCIQFAEGRGLLPTTRICPTHKRPMTLMASSGQVGEFRCGKSNCRTNSVSRATGTWFERFVHGDASLTLTEIFKIMYAFCMRLSYNQTRNELSEEACPVVSVNTVADLFSYCQETVATYELENQKAQEKKGDDDIVKLSEVVKSCEDSWRRRIKVGHLDAYEELIEAIKHVYKIDW